MKRWLAIGLRMLADRMDPPEHELHLDRINEPWPWETVPDRPLSPEARAQHERVMGAGRARRASDKRRVEARPMTDPCPNPKCQNGEVPGGSKGWLVCPDCKGDPMAMDDAGFLRWCSRMTGTTLMPKCGMVAVADRLRALGVIDLPGTTRVTDTPKIIPPAVRAYLAESSGGPRSYPDSTENPLDPPPVGGTEVTRPT